MLRLKRTRLAKMLRQRRDAGSLPSKAEYERGPGRRKAKGIVETHAGTPIDRCAKENRCVKCRIRLDEIEELKREEERFWKALEDRDRVAMDAWKDI